VAIGHILDSYSLLESELILEKVFILLEEKLIKKRINNE
jgi:hypothetical protein